jgi:hypothetical protein
MLTTKFMSSMITKRFLLLYQLRRLKHLPRYGSLIVGSNPTRAHFKGEFLESNGEEVRIEFDPWGEENMPCNASETVITQYPSPAEARSATLLNQGHFFLSLFSSISMIFF